MTNAIIIYFCFALLFICYKMRKDFEYSGKIKGQVDVLYLLSSALIKIEDLIDENKENKEFAEGLEKAMNIVNAEIQKLGTKK